MATLVRSLSSNNSKQSSSNIFHRLFLKLLRMSKNYVTCIHRLQETSNGLHSNIENEIKTFIGFHSRSVHV